jgi:hypothetical protein
VTGQSAANRPQEHRLRTSPFCVLSLAALAGCGYPSGPGSTDLVDGSYRGRPALQAANPTECPGTHYGYVELGDRDLHFAYLPNIVFEAPVQANGAVHDVRGPAVLDGKVVDDTMIFSVTTPQCHTDYSLHFIWNHS